jgi:hypothetical protein
MRTAANLLGLRVRVYRNLHNGLYSVQHRGRVIAHVAELTLAGATFTVQPAGRAKVVATRKKLVHAFVNGTVVAPLGPTLTQRVSYNPYKAGHFVLSATNEAVLAAPFASVTGSAVFI